MAKPADRDIALMTAAALCLMQPFVSAPAQAQSFLQTTVIGCAATTSGSADFNLNIPQANCSAQASSGGFGNVAAGFIGIGQVGSDGEGATIFDEAGDGGSGWDGPSVIFMAGSAISSTGTYAQGVSILSAGGLGGNGGVAGGFRSGGAGGNGGDGGEIDISVQSGVVIVVGGENAAGIYAVSLGGAGGQGGDDENFGLGGGDGAAGGNGGDISIANNGQVTMSGLSANGIYAESQGGIAGPGGEDDAFAFGSGGSGGTGGNSGAQVSVVNGGIISTSDDYSTAVLLLSAGGNGGEGGGGVGLFYALGGSGGAGGAGEDIIFSNSGMISTQGDSSHGLGAHSIGGGGGAGGDVVAVGFAGGVAIGGSAGGGGWAGDIMATNSGNILTAGAGSKGISAMSVGGGGGDGGNATTVVVGSSVAVAVAIGGTGGFGGDGGTVAVTNDAGGNIATGVPADPTTPIDPGTSPIPGDHANGILAQSIGGGGGTGGFATAVSLAVDEDASLSVALAMGGSGGGGGDGDDVTVINDGTILTHARQAHGIVAQSIGGGGGSGGNSVVVTAAISDASGAVSVGLGGSGGDGGTSGDVSVTHSGSIKTLSSHSSGIVAQAIGGGGGNGGNVINVSAAVGSNSASVNVGLGGSGGEGGIGGTVTVSDGAGSTIVTAGHQSHGFIAQSVGGGGGNGGNVHSYGISVNAGSGIAATGNVNIGGQGGLGDVGGSASGSVAGSIVTSGDDAKGAIVQSIGGGGGNGGNTFELSVAASIDQGSGGGGQLQSGRPIAIDIGVGGSGGNGNQGGNAQFSLEDGASVSTQGVRSTGVLVQSIGGGGGNGGTAKSLAVSTSVPTSAARFQDAWNAFSTKIQQWFGDEDTPDNTPQVNARSGLEASVSVGGNGGTGAMGGQVSITTASGSVISTSGHQAHGVHAQSVGGGGGTGGMAISDSFAGIGQNSIELSIGGQGGSAAEGGDVGMTPADADASGATITTTGASAHGIFLQSIGGGGGEGGSAASSAYSIPKLSGKSLQISIGGNGGSSGNGGVVYYSGNDDVSTSGATSFAIFAQSVGGGGGAAHFSDDTGNGGNASASGLFAVGIGGAGGAAGDGGSIDLEGEGSLATSGDASAAIFAQSVGGGGGSAGLAGGAFSPLHLNQALSFDMGLAGGNGGVGGDVTIKRGGSITTTGDVSAGIFAQSVGGGGGAIHAANLSTVFHNNSISIEHSSSNGNGGQIWIDDTESTSALNIRTSGDGSHGMVAQSLGASGGTVIIDEDSNALQLDFDSLTSSGVGAGGTVNVILQGQIATSGDAAYGILAQALSGQVVVLGTDGVSYIGDSIFTGAANINLNAASSVVTTGQNAHGIVVSASNTAVDIGGDVQVSGEGAWGVRVTSYDGQPEIAIQFGGSVTAVGSAAGAILVDDQAFGANIIVNGTIYAPDAVAISVQTVGYSPISIADGGVVEGDIVGPDQATGSTVVNLSNGGTIAGSVSNVQSYAFSRQGIHYLAFDPTGGPSDSISVTDLQVQSGQVVPLLKELPTSNVQSATIVSLESVGPAVPIDTTPMNLGLFGLGASPLPTTYTYELTQSTATITGVSVDFTRAGLTGNGAQLAQFGNTQLAAWSTNAPSGDSADALETLLLAAANGTTTQQVLQNLQAFDPTTHFAPVQSSAAASGAAQTNMQSCGDSSAAFALIAQDDCYWGKITYAVSHFRGGDQREQSVGLSVGSQYEVAPNIFLGGSLGIEDTDFSSKHGASDGNRVSVGGILKYVNGPFYSSAALLGSHGWADATRYSPVVGFTGVATADHRTSDLAMRLRAAYVFEHGSVGIMPLLDFDLMAIHDEGYTESGMGVLNMHVDNSTNVLADIRPALRLGATEAMAGAHVTSYVEAGVRFALNEGEIQTSLEEGPDSSSSITLNLGRDRVVSTFSAGTMIDWGAMELRAVYDGTAGEDTTTHAGSLKFGWKF